MEQNETIPAVMSKLIWSLEQHIDWNDELTLLGIPEIESVIVKLDVLYSRENSEEHSIETVG